MLQDAATTEYKHRKFVQRVAQFEIVWLLESEAGYATSSSNEFEDVGVFPFWSDRAYASAAAKEEWAEYHPSTLPLAEFLENWLVGLYNDDLLVGTNWDANGFGHEIEPLELALEIVGELRMQQKILQFEKFSDLANYEEQVREASKKPD